MGKKSLVVYYSKNGNTKKVAERISEILWCDIEEIKDLENRNGKWAYIKSCIDAKFGRFTSIDEDFPEIKKYDLIIIGTPTWAGSLTPAVRTFIKEYGTSKNVAFFCTCGGGNTNSVFKEMETKTKKPIAILSLKDKEIQDLSYIPKVLEFVERLKG